MLAKRVIPCLDVLGGRVVKGVQFENLQDSGDAVELARRYNEEGADELVFLDIGATVEERATTLGLVEKCARELFIPLTVGGGVRTVEDGKRFLDAGADKVAVNSAALADPELITGLAEQLGSQAVVVAIDAKREGQGWQVRTHAGRRATEWDAVAWAREAVRRGAGEILLTSMDADGGQSGFDLELNRAVSDAVPVPVIASGGAGLAADFMVVFQTTKVQAALAASIFHRRQVEIHQIKAAMREVGIPVRWTP